MNSPETVYTVREEDGEVWTDTDPDRVEQVARSEDVRVTATTRGVSE